MWIDNFCAAEFMSHRVGIHYFRLSSMSESYLYRSMDPLKDRGVGNILVCRKYTGLSIAPNTSLLCVKLPLRT